MHIASQMQLILISSRLFYSYKKPKGEKKRLTLPVQHGEKRSRAFKVDTIEKWDRYSGTESYVA